MDNEKFVNRIGENIVKLRKEKGLKQIDLAIKLDMEDSALRRIEKGRTNPTILTLKKIADALQVSINEIIPSK